ncbi:MAG: hypothetical protein MJ168_08100 [Clostridia bacterium]|nr:hypothetical protein [Clostridia bacterium]
MIEHVVLKNLTTNVSITLDAVSTEDYVLERIEIDPLTANYSLQPLPTLYGDALANTRLNTRRLKITAWILPALNADGTPDENSFKTRKAKIDAFVIPTNEIELTINARDRQSTSESEYKLKFLPLSTPQYGTTIEDNNEYMCKFIIEGVCLNPLFELLRFNREYTVAQGTAPYILHNYGDMATGIVCDMTLKSGYSAPLTLTVQVSGISTHKSYGIITFKPSDQSGNLTLEAGNTIHLDTRHGEELVTLIKNDGEVYSYAPAIKWSTASWIYVPVGENCNLAITVSGSQFLVKSKMYEYYMGV